jgi:nicotinamide mononucleotide transporter
MGMMLSATQPKLHVIELLIIVSVSCVMLLLAGFQVGSLSITETLGFVTGGTCVWLVVREHAWNWPIGLTNNVLFFWLFLRGKLYGDMGLQVVYFGLGVWGWHRWLNGGDGQETLRVSRTTRSEWITIILMMPIGVWRLRHLIFIVNGAAPFGDALTTVLSLVAQYLMCQKRLENWWFWIAADLIYVPLYFSRNLPLTGVLYAILLIMCIVGLREWRRGMESQPASGSELAT